MKNYADREHLVLFRLSPQIPFLCANHFNFYPLLSFSFLREVILPSTSGAHQGVNSSRVYFQYLNLIKKSVSHNLKIIAINMNIKLQRSTKKCLF